MAKATSMKAHLLTAAALLAVTACGRQAAQPPTERREAPAPRESLPSPVVMNNSGRLSPRASLPEPNGPIDPKSVEAAGQVVQSYGAYLESGDRPKAAALWSDGTAAEGFARQLDGATHIEIGDLGPAEGAAGSIYTTVPVTFVTGNAHRPANIVLRHVNDVPGSTEAQRHWHIERIDWTSAG